MTAPLDRVQRLREETAKATDGPWRYRMTHLLEGTPVAEVHGDVVTRPAIGAEAFTHVASGIAEESPEGPWLDAGDAAHIARWDPAAAALVLDLLAGVLTAHDGGPSDCHECTTALAVLDALDGGGE